jgi:hypothetical protein
MKRQKGLKKQSHWAIEINWSNGRNEFKALGVRHWALGKKQRLKGERGKYFGF